MGKNLEDSGVEIISEENGKLTDRADRVRDDIDKVKVNIEGSYVKMAQLLSEAWENGYFVRWGFESFKDYCHIELDMKPRRAMYFVQIAQTVKKLGVNWDEIQDIGWSKMVTLLPVLKGKNDVSKWRDLALNTSNEELKRQVDDNKELVIDEGKQKIVTLNLRMSEAEASIVMQAVEKAKEIISTESSVSAMEHICYDWTIGYGDSEIAQDHLPLEKVLEWVFKTYGVVCLPESQADLSKLTDSIEVTA